MSKIRAPCSTENSERIFSRAATSFSVLGRVEHEMKAERYYTSMLETKPVRA